MAAPCVTFVGPDENGITYVKDPYGNRTPLLAVSMTGSKPNVMMMRIYPNGQQVPFSSATFSSMSGSITVPVAGYEIKMRLDGVTGGREFDSPLGGGKMKWTPTGWGNEFELKDERKVKVAHLNASKGAEGLPTLSIFVQASDPFVDMVLAQGMATYMQHKKDDKDAVTALKVIGKIAGM